MKELLERLTAGEIDQFTAAELDEARQTLADTAAQIASGELEVDDRDGALEEIEQFATMVAEQAVKLAEQDTARAEKLAAINAKLGIEATVPDESPDVDDEADDDEAEAEAEVVAEEKVPVTASANLKAIAARVPKDRQPEEAPVLALTAAAGPNQGTAMNRRDLSTQMIDAAKRINGYRPGSRLDVATFSWRDSLQFVIDDPDSAESAMRAFEGATRLAAQGNQPGVGALTASGGICAPAEPRYEFFNIATRAGLLDLPTVGASRGRVTYSVSPSIGDFIGQSGIASVWTNTTDTTPGESTKPVFTFVCPENLTCTIAAYPTILQFGNFAARFYPEAVDNATSLAMIAADRVVNAARIAAVVAAADSYAPTDTGAGGIVNFITNIASAASDYRERYGMGPDAVLDGAAPAWVREALYVDAVARDATTAYDEVQRRVNGALTNLNVRFQWVYDLDDANDNLFPQTADVLLWAPGTVVELDAGELNLGVVRDSTLNSTNDFQVFSEPFVGWCFPGHEVLLLNEVEVCPTGGTGARVSIACPATS